MPNVLLDLLLPTGCAGCGEPGAALCPSCGAAFGGPRPHRPDPCPPALPQMAVCAGYDGPARAALLAYKEHRRRDITNQLGFALASAVAALVHNRGAPALCLVPVPSSRAAARARGGDHVLRLAEVAGRQLTDAGLPTHVAPWLRVTRRVQDSAGLSAARRAANLAGAFEVRPGARLTTRSGGRLATRLGVQLTARSDEQLRSRSVDQLRTRPGAGLATSSGGPLVCLVDDVITTGSTVAEACRALRSAGVDVGAIAAIAGTYRRRHSSQAQ